MITAAAQAFTFCAGSIAARADLPEAQRYAVVFRKLAELCSDIPSELPGPHVVAFALLHIGHDGDGYREVWREAGRKLADRVTDPLLKPFSTDATPEQIASLVEALKSQAAETPIIPGPGVDIEFIGDRRLSESVWLWQMLAHACECRTAMIPPLLQNPRTGQLAIQQGSLTQVITASDAQAIQRDRQILQAISDGLRNELRVLIGQLCPERTDAIKKAVAEQLAKMEAQKEGPAPEASRLTIVKD